MENIWNNEKLIKTLKNGGVAVMPTDTIYGIVGQALNLFTVERIYNIKRIKPEKPCIALIGEMKELKKFFIELTLEQKNILAKEWPGPTSVILDCPEENFSYLHRGTETVSLRLPKSPELRNLLKKTGPLVATSANLAGREPAKDIAEAQNYFGDSIDLYVDGGKIFGKASKLIRLHKDGSVSILRE